MSVDTSLQFSALALDAAMLKTALAESDPQLLLMILVQLTGDTALLEAFRPFIKNVKEQRPEDIPAEKAAFLRSRLIDVLSRGGSAQPPDVTVAAGIVRAGNLILHGECQANYIASCLRHLKAQGRDAIEVRREAFDRYVAEVDERLARSLWSTPGISNWFKNSAGRVTTNSPWRLVEYWQMTRRSWKYAYMPSTHEPATVGELIINADVSKKLPDYQKEVIKSATMEATLRSQLVMNTLNAEALVELKEKHGVTVGRTPEDILTKTLETWDQIAKEAAAKNPFFKKVYEAQRGYASRVVPARRDVYPPYGLSANYYWPEKK